MESRTFPPSLRMVARGLAALLLTAGVAITLRRRR